MRIGAVALFCVSLAWVLPGSASAQYMYLDVDNDGVNTPADRLNPIGVPTTVHVYLLTNRNRDGSQALCNSDPSTPLDVTGYQFHLRAVNGTVRYTEFVNLVPGMQPGWSHTSQDGIWMSGWSGSSAEIAPGGPYALARLTITALSGGPGVEIADTSPFGSTVFQTSCIGNSYDPVYQLNGDTFPADWSDVDGLLPQYGPTIQAPSTLRADGSSVTFQITTSAAPGDSITQLWMDASELPAGQDARLEVAPDLSGGQFSWNITCPLGPTYVVTFHATSRSGLTASVTTSIRLSQDSAPIVTIHRVLYTRQAGLNQISVSAADPDGDPIQSWTWSAPAGSSPTFTTSLQNAGGLLSWMATSNDTASYDVTFTASNTSTGTATSHVIGEVPPQITAPPDAQVMRGQEVRVTVNAVDVNNDAITTLAPSTLPPGEAVFTRTGNSGVLTLRPGAGRW